MDNIKKSYSPYIRVNDNVSKVMFDVVIALIPCILISYFAFGIVSFLVILTSVFSAVLGEFFFSVIFLKRTDSVKDLSAVVTGILLSLSLAPFTPLYVVAFGGFTAVVFGKLMAGGLGRNIFNPALLGREFMTVFFPTVMNSSLIWYNEKFLKFSEIKIFSFLGENELVNYLNKLFFTVSGAIGEYSIFFLVLGGIYLICKDRISWHITFGMFITVFLGIVVCTFFRIDIKIALGGMILGGVYMATDMPTSTSMPKARLYYGTMIGVAIILCWLNKIEFETLSYSILILNLFKNPIENVCRPRVFGVKSKAIKNMLNAFLLFLIISITVVIIIFFHHNDMIKYLLYIYIIYISIRFIRSKEIN